MNVDIKLSDNGKCPVFKRDGDACCDCYSAEGITIPIKSRRLVNLGFSIAIPTGYEGIIRPRSGLSSQGIDVAIGTIDSNYRGEVKANVINNSTESFRVNFGDRICQLAIRKTEDINFNTVDILDDTNRGEQGFGSSGI